MANGVSNGGTLRGERHARTRNELDDADVLANWETAVRWCRQAAEDAATHDAKPWKCALIPHDVIAENMTLKGLVQQYGVQ